MDRITIKETINLIKKDYASWLDFYKRGRCLRAVFSFLFSIGTITVNIYRIAHYFYRSNLKIISRLFYVLNVILTGAEIAPRCRIGGGFLLLHPTGTVIVGIIGENVVISGMTGIGADGSKKSIGAGLGLPIIGDGVRMGIRSSISGPIRIGSGSMIRACTFIRKETPENSYIYGNPAKVRPIEQADEDVVNF